MFAQSLQTPIMQLILQQTHFKTGSEKGSWTMMNKFERTNSPTIIKTGSKHPPGQGVY